MMNSPVDDERLIFCVYEALKKKKISFDPVAVTSCG